jgi:acetyl esterase/lipase
VTMLFVIVHGGFWKPEYDRAHAQCRSAALALAGWSVLTLEYRRIPGLPQATLSDMVAALNTLPGLVALAPAANLRLAHELHLGGAAW